MTQSRHARKAHKIRKRNRAERRWARLRPLREAAAGAFSDFWQAVKADSV